MNKIILISIIRDEDKIIERFLNNILLFVDAICITDTCSTDNTINIISKLFKEFVIPSKLYHTE